MTKELTLNQTWIKCLQMWKYVDKMMVKYPDSQSSTWKNKWLDKNKYFYHTYKGRPNYGCFFCDYAEPERISKVGCARCPGQLVDESFHCEQGGVSYNWNTNPREFYAKLVELNAKRKEQNNAKS